MVEVKAGQWWTDKGSVAERHRILVRGLTSKGDIVFCESADGRACTLTLEYFLKFKEHLPECTSFEWVPEPALRKITLTTFTYCDELCSPYVGISVDPEHLAGIRNNWKHVSILKTEEFEVPCE